MKTDYSLLFLLIPIIVMQLVFQVAALIDLSRREKVTGGRKIVWILVIVLGELLGAIVYFVFGRKDD